MCAPSATLVSAALEWTLPPPPPPPPRSVAPSQRPRPLQPPPPHFVLLQHRGNEHWVGRRCPEGPHPVAAASSGDVELVGEKHYAALAVYAQDHHFFLMRRWLMGATGAAVADRRELRGWLVLELAKLLAAPVTATGVVVDIPGGLRAKIALSELVGTTLGSFFTAAATPQPAGALACKQRSTRCRSLLVSFFLLELDYGSCRVGSAAVRSAGTAQWCRSCGFLRVSSAFLPRHNFSRRR